MEYVQVALFQIVGSRAGDASGPGGLLEALDEHRGYLEHQLGFLDMRVVRSINDEGNVQIVVETRWAEADDLVRYETAEPNVQSVLRSHQDDIIPNSLQVYDMEALRADSPREAPAVVARERVTLPLVVPIAAFAFGLLVVYGLSRIYLELRPVEVGDLSIVTPLALGVAAGILLVSWFVASRQLPMWQIGGIVVLVAGLLLGGSIAAAVHDEDATEAEHPAGEQSPLPGASAPPSGAQTIQVSMGDNFFDIGGQRNANIPIPANRDIVIALTNNGRSIHNLQIAGPDNRYDNADDIKSNPESIRASASGTATFKFTSPGTINYRCEFHPDDMKGTITVQ